MSTETTSRAPMAENGGRGPRCNCGHYATEHGGDLGCTGAYATLMADADDPESVEVLCPCTSYWPRPADSLPSEVRSS